MYVRGFIAVLRRLILSGSYGGSILYGGVSWRRAIIFVLSVNILPPPLVWGQTFDTFIHHDLVICVVLCPNKHTGIKCLYLSLSPPG